MGCCLSTTADDAENNDALNAGGAGDNARRQRRRQAQAAVDFGHGVRWTAEQPMTQQALEHQRDEFWETAAAYEGRSEIWQALRLACESDDQQLAQTVVDSVGVTVPTGRLTDGAFDERGASYMVPQYCLSAPINLVAAADECESTHSSDRLSARVSNKASGGQGIEARASLDSTQSVGLHTAVLHSPTRQGLAASSASRAATSVPLYSPASVGSSDGAGSLVSLYNGSGSSSKDRTDVRTVRVRLSSGADAQVRLAPDTSVAQVEAQLRAGGYIAGAVQRVRFLHLGRVLAPQLVPVRDLRLTETAVIQAMYSAS
ncbi:hypothetical protein H4R19_002941 [Coemansia spiralis]|nr:hypothetical protein H4R19_002941 [Coemansia spiralis]